MEEGSMGGGHAMGWAKPTITVQLLVALEVTMLRVVEF